MSPGSSQQQECPDEFSLTPPQTKRDDKSEIAEEPQEQDVVGENIEAAAMEIAPLQCDTITASSTPADDMQAHDSMNFDWKDPGKWPLSLRDRERMFLVEKGPFRYPELDYPEDENKRHFSSMFFTRKLSNGETVDRKWLIYSKHNDAAYCFACKLFSDTKIKLTTEEGYRDWKHASQKLTEHESSTKHTIAMKVWFELQIRVKTEATIDKQNQQLLEQEARHWKNVLERIISIVQYLSERNLAFRGNVDRLFQPHNGNFLGLVELLAKYDNVLQEHIRRIKSNEISDHYLGKRIQNEIIELMGNAVLQKILEHVRKAKYFSIILDCTPDASHQEQMTVMIRIVNLSPVEISEYFVGFLHVESSKGEDLAEACLQRLQQLQIPFQNCRGQGYDNGSNMKGCHQGVQKRLLDLNPKAFYVPCGCHSLNLMLGDMAKSSIVASMLFGILHQIYLLFAASTQRWEILKSHIQNLTVKPISETRWECRIDSVKAVRFQVGAVYDALVEVSETANDPKAHTEAAGLAKHLKNYQFLVSLVIWNDLLARINIVSKLMQAKDMQFDIALKCVENTTEFLKTYKETGFELAQTAAKELAAELEMNSDEIAFPAPQSMRRRKIRRQFEYECQDEPISDPKEKYRIEFFNVLLDQAIMSMNARFEQMKEHFHFFGFLHDFKTIATMSQKDLMKHCTDLGTILTDASSSDIDPVDFCNELGVFCTLVPSGNASARHALEFINQNNLNDTFPNVAIALRIALTNPITVASGERSFSKLKLIKNYLRTSMTQERLNHLAMLSIETDVVKSLDYSQLIKEFASLKARKIDFLS